jgi:hypothetical protein
MTLRPPLQARFYFFFELTDDELCHGSYYRDITISSFGTKLKVR